jgi:hypothetical protein
MRVLQIPEQSFLNTFFQPKFAGFGTAGTFDPHRTIQDQTVAKPIWSVEYYAKFFDVDTPQVIERCMASVIPKENFLDVMGGSPDLYGMYLFTFLNLTTQRESSCC